MMFIQDKRGALVFVRTVFFTLFLIVITACAQVPKESVELSATVGRDLAIVHDAHLDLAKVLFSRMRRDIHRFIDDVYAPHQIRQAMARQKELADSSNPEERKKSLLLAINAAFTKDAPPELQEKVLKGMEIMVKRIRDDIESMRKELLDPLEAQEKEVLGSIDRSYQKLHYANSIVTGHLSSVAKVHETQDKILKELGIERDLRKEIGETLSMASEKISSIIETAEKTDEKLAKAEENAKKIKDTLMGFLEELNKKAKKGEK